MTKKPATSKASSKPSKHQTAIGNEAPVPGETFPATDLVPADAALTPSFQETHGAGGETHQIAGDGVAMLTRHLREERLCVFRSSLVILHPARLAARGQFDSEYLYLQNP